MKTGSRQLRPILSDQSGGSSRAGTSFPVPGGYLGAKFYFVRWLRGLSSPDVSTESRGREVSDKPGLRVCPLLKVGWAGVWGWPGAVTVPGCVGSRVRLEGFIRVQLKPHILPSG